MAEYIDREKLENKLNQRWGCFTSRKEPLCEYGKGFGEALAIVENFTSEDVAPVVHGKWEFSVFVDGDANDPRCKCSECGSIETPLARHKYCPNCGARMDGEQNATD